MRPNLRPAFPLFNANAVHHSPAMSDKNEPSLAPLTEQELEAGLDRFSALVESADAPEKIIEWLDNEAGDLLDGLWTACGERLSEDEWDAMFAVLPRIYAIMVPDELDRYEIDVERLTEGFAAWEKNMPEQFAASHFSKSRQPLVMEDVLTLLTDIIAQESVFHGPSKRIAVALLAAAVDELDRTVCESKEDDEEGAPS